MLRLTFTTSQCSLAYEFTQVDQNNGITLPTISPCFWSMDKCEKHNIWEGVCVYLCAPDYRLVFLLFSSPLWEGACASDYRVLLYAASTVTGLSRNFSIGFGSFVEKVAPPFTTLNRDLQLDPCPNDNRFDCEPTYSYRHIVSLTNQSSRFTVCLLAETSVLVLVIVCASSCRV
jgi:hypothetical protein